MTQSFSAVLDSTKQVKNITLTEDKHQKVFLEGNIGQLRQVKLIEGLLLEIVGTKGVLRIDMPVEVIRKAIKVP